MRKGLSTIDVVERDLADERGLLYRYRGGDGLDGPEGTFLLCTFWLAHALAITGQTGRARVVLDRAASYATELGLFSEQVDTANGELLGNFPQAFSHLGLVTAAHALALAETEEALAAVSHPRIRRERPMISDQAFRQARRASSKGRRGPEVTEFRP